MVTDRLVATAVASCCAACSGAQSALEPAGRDAARIAGLWWWLAATAVVIWLAVIGLGVYVTRVAPGPHARRSGVRLVVIGGVVAPAAILTAVLVAGLSRLPDTLAPGPEDGLHIEITGRQWWWRVRLHPPVGEPVELANELRLPVGERVELRLRSADVIHSFWVPALGGKIDMIPGRTNRLALEPTRTGTFRGACAEFCGSSHALMSLVVVVMERDAFDAWLAAERAPAAEPAGPAARRGRGVFLSTACVGCHTIRGTAAAATYGPDLTHVGGRLRLGAGVLPNDSAAFQRWLSDPAAFKPGAHMPGFGGVLPAEDLAALAAYLDGLQ